MNEPSLARGQRIRILLVEDSPGDAFLVKRSIAELPEPRPRVMHVESLGSALELLAKEPFDLVITDLNLPDSDGLETCRTLCEQAQTLPVVVLTSTLPDLGTEAIAMGAQDYLIKDKITSQELIRVLHHARTRHELMRDIRATERNFRELLAAAPAVIYRASSTNHEQMLFVSDTTHAILGYAPENFTLRQGFWRDCLHEADRARVLTQVPQMTSGIATRDYRFRHGNGSWIWVRDQYRVLTAEDDQASDIVGCMVDVTEQKSLEQSVRMAMEAAQSSSQAKSAFLGQMSHELRTPLNAILGFGELLRDLKLGDLTEKQARFVNNILKSGQHLLGLITDVLDLTKIEAGKMTLNVTAFSVEGVIREVVDLLQAMALKKAIVISVDITGVLPAMSADELKFRQILYNALSNALKFTPDGGRVFITAATVRSKGPDTDPGHDQLLALAIRDTGIGVEPEDLETIFGEFTQIYTQESGRQPGTGLGLTLTRRLVELHGGRIWAESEGAGKGLTMMIEMPFGVAQAVLSGSGTVMVIENNDLDRELLVSLLESMGCNAIPVGPEGAVLQLISDLKPDLVVLTLGQSGTDGLDLVRCLRLEPRTRQVPVIAVTADEDGLGSASALAAGCSLQVTKPLDIASFRTVVEEILGAKRRMRRRSE